MPTMMTKDGSARYGSAGALIAGGRVGDRSGLGKPSSARSWHEATHRRLPILRTWPPAALWLILSVLVLCTCSPVALDLRNPQPLAAAACFSTDQDASESLEPSEALIAGWEDRGLPFDLSGSWAQREVSATISVAPIVGQINTRTTSFLRVDYQQVGSHIIMTAEDCGLFSETSTSLSRVIIPDAYIEAIEPGVRHAVVEPYQSGYRFRQHRFTRVMGVDLEDPPNDPLPDDADDPRVRDHDGDGHPGVTIRIEGVIDGDVYVVQRNWNEMCGTVMSPDRIEGYLRWGSDQKTIGASSFLLNNNLESMPDPDLEKHRFTACRVDPTLTCAELVSQGDALFESCGQP